MPFVLPASNDIPAPIPLKALAKDVKPAKAEKIAEKSTAKAEPKMPEFKAPEAKNTEQKPEQPLPELKAPEPKASPASPFTTPAAAMPLKKDLPFRIISSAEETVEPAVGSGVSVAESLFSFATKPVAKAEPARPEAAETDNIKAEAVNVAPLAVAPTPAAPEPAMADSANPKAVADAAAPATVVEYKEEQTATIKESQAAPAQTEAKPVTAKPARPSLKDRFTAVASEDSAPADAAKPEPAAPAADRAINPFTGKPSLADKLADKMQSKAALNPAPMGKIARPAAPRPEYVLTEQKEARFWSKIPLPVRYLMIAAAIFAMYSLFMSWLHEDEPAPVSTVAEGSADTSALPVDEPVTVESSHEVSNVTAPVASKAPPSAIPSLPSMPKNPESHSFNGPVRTAAPVAPVLAKPVELMPSITVTPKAEVSGGSLSKAPLTAPASLPQPSPMRNAVNTAIAPEMPVGGAMGKQEPVATAAVSAPMPAPAAKPMPVSPVASRAAAPETVRPETVRPEPVRAAPASSTPANTAPTVASKAETVDEKRLLDLLQRP